MKTNKIAVIHDILIDYGGAERTLEFFLKNFKNCDVYTFYIDKKSNLMKSVVGKSEVKSSIFQKMPLEKLGRYISFFKPFAWAYFYFLKIPKYETVISFSSSYNSKLYRKSNNQKHICYMFTPPKYLYNETNDMQFIKRFPYNLILHPALNLLKIIDQNSMQGIDKVIAISATVQNRIKRHYKVDSEIIYPPLTIKRPKGKVLKKNYYLFLSRLVQQKGVDLVLSLAKKYNLKIKFAGKGYLGEKINKNNSVEFIGFVDENKLAKLYSEAKALIYCAKDEDFGLVPVESIYCNTPVVAYKSGGVEETIIDNKSGVLFTKFDVNSLYQAIKKIERMRLWEDRIYKYVKKFEGKYFARKFKKIIYKVSGVV